MKKGFYFIVVNDDDKEGNSYMKPELTEGSYEYHGKLFVHRNNGYEGHVSRWRVSHVDSGSNISRGNTLRRAREIAKGLQGFSVWELKDHQSLTSAVACPSNAEQINKIKRVLGLIT